MANLLEAVRERFFSELQSQTNWGKNQIQALYNEVQLSILSSKFSNDEILNENAISIKDVLVAVDKSFKEKKDDTRGYYNPRGSDTYNDVEHNISSDDSPFFDDEDIKKGF